MKVTVKYDGPAIESGRMDARDLAPAMLATAKLFEHSAGVMYGTTTGLKIEVQANFRGGSFAYDIVTRVVSVASLLRDNLSASDIIDTGALLILALKHARGRAPKEVVRGEEAKLIFHDGDTITVNAHVATMYLNPAIRADVEGAVEPLKKAGIEEFTLTTPTDKVLVTKDEVDYLNAPAPGSTVLRDRIEDEIVEILSPHFKEGNKWQFALAGEGPFWARVLDEEFLRRVRDRELGIFSGDLYHVKMRVVVTQLSTGKPDRLREIVEVGERADVSPYKQGTLFD